MSNPQVVPQTIPRSDQAYQHLPVLVEAVRGFVPPLATLLADVTLGGGGHAAALLGQAPRARLFGSDRDSSAVSAAGDALHAFASRMRLKQLAFSQIHTQLPVASVDFLLADLGVSSPQLERAERGFSFVREGPLDMRMNPEGGGRTAGELLNTEPEPKLQALLFQYGQERFAKRIVKAILAARQSAPLRSTLQLAELVAAAVPAGRHRLHPATRTFQALRIAVNDELGELEQLLAQALPLLKPGGRMAVISFHSLEDRLVKTAFTRWEKPCACPPKLPVCICKKNPEGRRLTGKPVVASPAETAHNPRSRSAKLRVFEKKSP